MNNGKMFDMPPKCPGMLSTKLTGLFGWRHTYRVHHRQKGINHFAQHNLHKSYSLNLPPKKHHETSASNPSLPEAASMVNSIRSSDAALKSKFEAYRPLRTLSHAMIVSGAFTTCLFML